MRLVLLVCGFEVRFSISAGLVAQGNALLETELCLDALSVSSVSYSALFSLCWKCMQMFSLHKIFVLLEFEFLLPICVELMVALINC